MNPIGKKTISESEGLSVLFAPFSPLPPTVSVPTPDFGVTEVSAAGLVEMQKSVRRAARLTAATLVTLALVMLSLTLGAVVNGKPQSAIALILAVLAFSYILTLHREIRQCQQADRVVPSLTLCTARTMVVATRPSVRGMVTLAEAGEEDPQRNRRVRGLRLRSLSEGDDVVVVTRPRSSGKPAIVAIMSEGTMAWFPPSGYEATNESTRP